MNTGGCKILIVDDELEILEFISYNLRKEGFSVITAGDGDECLSLASELLPDLIVLDIRMPGISGIETCRRLRQNPDLKTIPVLFLTADQDEYTFLSAMEAGGTHFITKPVRPAIIISMICELMHLSN
jgi:two-component system, OmpR family, alkaline phosphatase synthesis response regulator PhoP